MQIFETSPFLFVGICVFWVVTILFFGGKKIFFDSPKETAENDK